MNQRPSVESSEQASVNPSSSSALGNLEQQTEVEPNKAETSRSDNEVVSLVHQPFQPEEEELTVVTDEQILFQAHLEELESSTTSQVDSPAINQTKSSLINNLLTPWGIGSILMLLIANTFLTWAELSNSSSPATTQASPEVIPSLIEQPQALSNFPHSIQLDLKTLSTLDLKPNASVALKLPTSPRPTAKPAIASQPTSNLATALLPPSLRPQPTQPYLTSPAAIPVSSPISSTASLPSPPAVQTVPTLNSFPQSLNPSLPPPPPALPNTVSPTDVTNAQIREQLRQEAEASSSVSFPQSTRMKMQATQGQNNPQQLIEQLQQLNQDTGANVVNSEQVPFK